MRDKVLRWLGPPSLADPEATENARTFHVVASTVTLVLCVSLALLILEQPASWVRRGRSVLVLAAQLVVLL